MLGSRVWPIRRVPSIILPKARAGSVPCHARKAWDISKPAEIWDFLTRQIRFDRVWSRHSVSVTDASIGWHSILTTGSSCTPDFQPLSDQVNSSRLRAHGALSSCLVERKTADIPISPTFVGFPIMNQQLFDQFTLPGRSQSPKSKAKAGTLQGTLATLPSWPHGRQPGHSLYIMDVTLGLSEIGVYHQIAMWI